MASESVFDGLITAEWKSNASLLMLAEDLATYPDLAEFRRVADSLREWMEVPESEWPASWPAGTHTRRAGCEVRCLRELARTLEKRLALDAVASQLARVRATAAAMAAVEEHVPKRQRGATTHERAMWCRRSHAVRAAGTAILCRARCPPSPPIKGRWRAVFRAAGRCAAAAGPRTRAPTGPSYGPAHASCALFRALRVHCARHGVR